MEGGGAGRVGEETRSQSSLQLVAPPLSRLTGLNEARLQPPLLDDGTSRCPLAPALIKHSHVSGGEERDSGSGLKIGAAEQPEFTDASSLLFFLYSLLFKYGRFHS